MPGSLPFSVGLPKQCTFVRAGSGVCCGREVVTVSYPQCVACGALHGRDEGAEGNSASFTIVQPESCQDYTKRGNGRGEMN